MPFVYRTTKLTLDLATKLVKADIRVHNLDVIRDDMAIIFAANHFTRIETFLLPHQFSKHTGKEVWSLASADLFKERTGAFMRALGCVSTKDPDRDKIIVRSLLVADHPWNIFPEGSMIKDKKLVNEEGGFEIYHQGKRRPPFTGAAVLALQAELHRQTLQRLHQGGNPAELDAAMKRFGLETIEPVLRHRTVIIPVNITYFPIRSQENVFLDMARRMSEKLPARALDELSVEGTILAKETNIDITLGEPIDVRTYIEGPEFERLAQTTRENWDEIPDGSRTALGEAAQSLMIRYMTDIYRLTTINFDHVFATLIRHQQARKFTERSYRNRIYLCARQILDLGSHQVHTLLRKNYRAVLYEDPSVKFQNFVQLCLDEKILRKEGNFYIKNFKRKQDKTGFHTIRQKDLVHVIANEIEPLGDVTGIIRKVAVLSRPELSTEIRNHFLKKDQQIFDQDYEKFFVHGESKPPEVGRPFLLRPRKFKAGIVLTHGYLAAPMEIRALGNFLAGLGYAVYGVRLRGHGTSPEDLAQTHWEEWYESLNRGYAVIKSLTDDIILGGFSMGGSLSLLAAARKADKVRAAFSINAPLHLRNYAVHLIPPIAAVNTLLARMKRRAASLEYVENTPENANINYARNPVSAIKELNGCIDAMDKALKEIQVPTLLLQGSKDPIVDPVSGQLIFGRIGTPRRELTYLPRERHGIVNGEGAEDVFRHVAEFLNRAAR